MLAKELVEAIPVAEQAAKTLETFAADLSRFANSAPSTFSNEMLGKYGIHIAAGSPLQTIAHENGAVSLLRGEGPGSNGLLNYSLNGESYWNPQEAREFLLSKDNGIQIVSKDGTSSQLPLNPAAGMIDRLQAGGIEIHRDSAFTHSYRDDGTEVLSGPNEHSYFTLAQLLPGNKLLWETAKEVRISPTGEVEFTSPTGWTHLPQAQRLVFDLGKIDAVSEKLRGASVPSYMKI